MPVQKSAYNLRQKAGETASPYSAEKNKSAQPSPAKGATPLSPTKQPVKPLSPTQRPANAGSSPVSKPSHAPASPQRFGQSTSATPQRPAQPVSPQRMGQPTSPQRVNQPTPGFAQRTLSPARPISPSQQHLSAFNRAPSPVQQRSISPAALHRSGSPVQRPISPSHHASTAGGSHHSSLNASLSNSRPGSPSKMAISTPSPQRSGPPSNQSSPTQRKLLEEIRSSKGHWSNAKAEIGSTIVQHGSNIGKAVLTNHVTPVVKHTPIPASHSRSDSRSASPSRLSHPASPQHHHAAAGQHRPASPTKLPVQSGGVNKATPNKISSDNIKKGLQAVGAVPVAKTSPKQKP